MHRELRKIITKDNNVAVVAEAIQCTGALAKGLRNAYANTAKSLVEVRACCSYVLCVFFDVSCVLLVCVSMRICVFVCGSGSKGHSVHRSISKGTEERVRKHGKEPGGGACFSSCVCVRVFCIFYLYGCGSRGCKRVTHCHGCNSNR